MQKHVLDGELSGLQIMRFVRQLGKKIIRARYSGHMTGGARYTIVYTI